MNGTARELIFSHHRNDAEQHGSCTSANASAFDALTGCCDAEYHYWLLRPAMTDATITRSRPK